MPTDDAPKRNIAAGKVFELTELVEYAEGSVVSRVLLKSESGSITLFAFDAGQELSEHSAPYDALAQVVDGSGEFSVGGQTHNVSCGQTILLPANIPHAVRAPAKFKMLLTMLRASA